ncbi:MAG: hypothetical protein AB7N80_13335 [Bdellovibrionales bacterium]
MGKFYKLSLVVLMVAVASASAQNAAPAEPLSFKSWKEQRQVEAQNQVARIGNRIVLLKAGKVKPEEIMAEFTHFADSEEGPKLTSRAQKLTSSDLLVRLEREQSRSQKNLEFAKDLGLQEYFLGYLNQFQENQAALTQVAGRLSKDEVVELLKVLLKANQQGLNSGKAPRLKPALGKLEASALIY